LTRSLTVPIHCGKDCGRNCGEKNGELEVPTNIITDTLVKTSEKRSEKRSEKILELVELNDVMTIIKIVATIGISEQSVERNQYRSPKMKGGFY